MALFRGVKKYVMTHQQARRTVQQHPNQLSITFYNPANIYHGKEQNPNRNKN